MTTSYMRVSTVLLLLHILVVSAALNTQDQKLWSAVLDGKEDKVKDLLLAGANPNALKYKSKKTMLMYSVWLQSYLTGDPTGAKFGPVIWGGSDDIAKLLIGAGASVNARSKNGMTALMFAARNNFDCTHGNCDANTVQTLLDAGAELHAKDNDDRTALMHAGRYGSSEVMHILSNDLNGADLYDHTHIDAAIALAKQGAQTEGKIMFAIGLTARKRGGLCPEWRNRRLVKDPRIVKLIKTLHTEENQIKMLEKVLEGTQAALVDDVCHNKRRPLMNSTANYNMKQMYCSKANIQDKKVGTLGVLYWAAVAGHCGVFEIAFVNSRNSNQIKICGGKNWTECMIPLKKIALIAAALGRSEMMRMMTDTYGADLIHKNRDANGDTPLALAKANGHLAVQIILEVYINKELIDDLIIYTHTGNVSMVKQLLADGADVNLHDLHGKSPLMCAVNYRKVQIAKLLLVAGAHADMGHLEHGTSKLQSGRTPLMNAAMGRDGNPFVQLLIDAGANVHAKDEYLSDPLMFASAYGNINAMKLLLAAGANPHNVDINGGNAADACNTRSDCHYEANCSNDCGRLLITSRY